MLRRWTVLVLLVVAGCSGTAGAEPDRLRDAAAVEGIEYLREIERRTPSEPPIDFTRATLGRAVPMTFVRLDMLREYRAGDDPRALLVAGARSAHFYTVLAEKRVRSSVVVRRDGDAWRPELFGRIHQAVSVDAVCERLEADGVAVGVTLVEIPGLPADFVSHDEGSDLVLTPLQDVPGTALVTGVSVPAIDAFLQLQPIAAAKSGR